MATRLKKRLSTKENKLIKIDSLELKDVICSICQSILVEPVTLPCYHHFCQRCFSGSVENNALCCPLCRLRIGSWLRTATKQNNLVNIELWESIRNKFPIEIETKMKGGDVYLEVTEKPAPRLSAPGEIRSEYEMELKRLREERIRLEEKHLQETELLIKKIQLEEAEAQKRYVEMLKQDEMLAKQIQKSHVTVSSPKVVKRALQTNGYGKPRLKPTRIDGYLAKTQAPVIISNSSPILTDDNSSTSECSPSIPTFDSRASPEVVPNYKRMLKTIIDKTVNSGIVHNDCKDKEDTKSKERDQGPSQTNIINQNKEETIRQTNSTKNCNEKETSCKEKETNNKESNSQEKEKKIIPPFRKSLPVSIPLPKSRVAQNKPLDNDLKKLIPLGVIQQRSILDYKNKQVFLTSKTPKFPERTVPKKIVEVGPTISSESDDKTCPEPLVTQTDNKNRLSADVKNKVSPESSKPDQNGDAPDRTLETDSVDSMLQELCYFKPIEKSTFKSVGYNTSQTQVMRVTCQRAGGEPGGPRTCPPLDPPSKAQYLEGLCRLRELSLANNLSSAFVIAMDILKVKKALLTQPVVGNFETNKRGKRNAAPNSTVLPLKKNALKIAKPSAAGDSTPLRRRTRSMGSLSKDVTTPRKAKIEKRISISERKHLRSDSKKTSVGTNMYSSVSKLVANNNIRSAAKNLSEPLNDCDVKSILQQIRIQKMIEKQDMELARKMDAEINGRRQPRRLSAPGSVKRQATLNYALRPAKKLKV